MLLFLAACASPACKYACWVNTSFFSSFCRTLFFVFVLIVRRNGYLHHHPRPIHFHNWSSSIPPPPSSPLIKKKKKNGLSTFYSGLACPWSESSCICSVYALAPACLLSFLLPWTATATAVAVSASAVALLLYNYLIWWSLTKYPDWQRPTGKRKKKQFSSVDVYFLSPTART